MRDPRYASSRESLTSIQAEPLLTRDYESRPALVYERLRTTYGPVAPVDLLGMPVWLVLGYPEALEVLGDEKGVWSKRLDHWRARAEGRVPPDWPLRPVFEVDSSTYLEGQRLGELRAAWSMALKPYQDRSHPQSRQLGSAVTSYADELITVLSEGEGRTGWADLSAQYTRPLPLMVLNRMLGFDSEQGDDVLMDMWRLLDAGPEAGAAAGRLLAALDALATAKMVHPGEDVPSYMLAARPEFTADELSRELLMLISFVGDFTGSLICNAVAEVISGTAGARDSLSAGMMAETVNRVAMASPPLANTFRFPTTDVVLGNFTIAAGDPVMVSIAASHTDPHFTRHMNPEAMTSSRAHLAWGAGPHQCLGRHLATSITTVAVSRLFERFSHLELTLPADQLPWRSSPLMRSLRSLPVKYELADPAGQQRSIFELMPRPSEQPIPASAVPPQKEPRSGGLWRFLRSFGRQGK